MITYRSSQEFELRFGRDERDPRFHFLEGQFEIQSYLDHQGKKFAERFDPNTYLYFSRAMDLYDLGKGYKSFDEAVARVQARALLLAVSSDFLVPVEQVKEVHDSLLKAGRDSRLAILDSAHGHDSFLIETDRVREELKRFFSAG